MQNKLLYLYKTLLREYKQAAYDFYMAAPRSNKVVAHNKIYNKHISEINNIEKLENILLDEKPRDLIEEKYELYKDIIEHLMVTDQEGNKIESLHHSGIYNPDGEEIMDYYDIQGTVENLGGDVTIHATIDEIIDFFKGKI